MLQTFMATVIYLFSNYRHVYRFHLVNEYSICQLQLYSITLPFRITNILVSLYNVQRPPLLSCFYGTISAEAKSRWPVPLASRDCL